LFPICDAWLWTAEDFEFYCRDTNAEIQFGADFYSYPVDVEGNSWTFYNITVGDGEELEYLMFSGSNCNVTLTELNNKKLYIATVADATASSQISLNSSYSLPYVQNISGAITALEVSFIENNRLTWSLTGEGPTTIKIPFYGHTPYYLKINGVVKAEGDHWSASGNTITVTDTLASTHDYELSFSGLPTPHSHSPPSDTDDSLPEQLVEAAETAKDVVVTYWIIILVVLIIIVVAGVIVYLTND